MEREHLTPKAPPPICGKCERTAVVLDADERPLCARHATIFMTMGRLDSRDPKPELAGTGS